MDINLTQNFTVIVTGHGKTRAYLHRFKIIEEPTCPCGTAEQTTDHIIFECEAIKKREGKAEDDRPTERQLANQWKGPNKEAL